MFRQRCVNRKFPWVRMAWNKIIQFIGQLLINCYLHTFTFSWYVLVNWLLTDMSWKLKIHIWSSGVRVSQTWVYWGPRTTFRRLWKYNLKYISKYSAFTDKAERKCHFSAPGRNCSNIGKLILLFLRSDTWLVSGKHCSAWRWVMQIQPGARKWKLRSTLSVNAL
jgi:hypothetical protein